MLIERKFDLNYDRRAISFVIVAIFLSALFPVFRNFEWVATAGLHTLMEAVATILALLVGSMALLRYYTKRNSLFLLVGTGFVGTGILDGYHAVVSAEYFRHFMPSDLPSLIPWSWLASRIFLSTMLFLAVVDWLREKRFGDGGRISERAVYATSAFLTLASILFFIFVPLPVGYFDSELLRRPEDLIPAILFAFALLGFWRKGGWRSDLFEYWLVMALVISVVSQVVFMPFSAELFDMDFNAAHLLKKASYICVLVGLMASMYEIFQREVEATWQLSKANKDLVSEVRIRRATENDLRVRSGELEAANKELDAFSYSVSHDLRAPLRSIDGFSLAMLEDNSDSLGENSRGYLERIRVNTRRMGKMINGLLKLSRWTQGEIRVVNTNLSKMAEQIAADLKERESDRNVTFNISENIVAPCDPELIYVVLQNLLENAWKYSSRKEHAVIEFGSIDDAGVATMFVRDNGVGFDMEFVDRLFGAFRQLHVDAGFGGTGIGLATVARVVRRHGGKVWAEGEVNKGATFYFELERALS
jgi:signal transduction histidine kinase